MSNGIEVAVQIRAIDTETEKDLPTYFTATTKLSQTLLDKFDTQQVAEDAVGLAVREVVADWAEEYDHE